jgi:predicted RNA-binding protein associated with RNAse of E/G family
VDVPKASTDYAVTLAEEWSSILKHSCYSHDGMSKGGLYNISTPIEFYPETIRYVDLEIDVVRRVGELRKVIDSDRLDGAVESGYVSSRLAQTAKDIARNLGRELLQSEALGP